MAMRIPVETTGLHFEVLESADGRHHRIAPGLQQSQCGLYFRAELQQPTTLVFRWCHRCGGRSALLPRSDPDAS